VKPSPRNQSDQTAQPEPEPLRQAAHFEVEFPGASRSASEVVINLVRTTSLFLAELDRRLKNVADLSASAWQALAVIEGAREPLPPHVIADRLLLTSGSITSLLDTLERRGLVRRNAHPRDRRKLLVDITNTARDMVDHMLPIVHSTAQEMTKSVSESAREQLILALAQMRADLEAMSSRPVPQVRLRRRAIPSRVHE
jgi:DNA-binding MarR family transcriptional regulator